MDVTGDRQNTSNRDKASSRMNQSQQSVKTNRSIASMREPLDIPDFFLYTKLNQNQTKDLRKAQTNRDERKVIGQIFGLSTAIKSPKDDVNRVDQVVLDFHFINYEYCRQNSFSNEKVSTFIAIMNFLLHSMVKHQMQHEKGVQLLKQILQKHSVQRPPYSIFIFTEDEIKKIVDFCLRTFFRHYSLYEYSFKPKVDLVLMTLPRDQEDRQKKDQAEAEEAKASQNALEADEAEAADPAKENPQVAQQEALAAEGASAIGSSPVIEQIDWEKVGKIYKPESAIEDILTKEMNRLQNALDQKIDIQDKDLETKYAAKKK